MSRILSCVRALFRLQGSALTSRFAAYIATYASSSVILRGMTKQCSPLGKQRRTRPFNPFNPVPGLAFALVLAAGLCAPRAWAADYVIDDGSPTADPTFNTLQELKAAHGSLLDGNSITFKNGDGSLSTAFTMTGGTLTLTGSGDPASPYTISAASGNTTRFLNSSGATTFHWGGGGLEFKGFNAGIGSGGAVYVNSTFYGGISGSTFTGNTADIGGAVYVNGAFNGGISGSTFSNNTAGNTAGYGGALYVVGAFNGGISDSTFTGNTAGYGGALYVVGTPTTVIGLSGNNVFSGNRADVNGSAIYLGTGNIAITGGSTTFRDNIGLSTLRASFGNITVGGSGAAKVVIAGNVTQTFYASGNINIANDATLEFALDDASTANPMLTLTSGTLSFDTPTVDATFTTANGTYTLLSSAGFDFDGQYIGLVNGAAEGFLGANERYGGAAYDHSTVGLLKLVFYGEDINRDATWTGATNSLWNETSDNWNLSGGSTLHVFKNGDTAFFNSTDATPGAITVDAAGVTAAAMSVSGDGDWMFSGGPITTTGGLTKTGAGTLTLNGDNTFSGVTVNGGTLQVNGSIATSSMTTINSGATLTGTGTVGNTTVASGGTLIAGNGTAGSFMAVNGNLVFAAGSTYQVAVDPTTASRTDVTGTANLAGMVTANYAGGAYTSKQYTILSATGGISGLFTLTNINLPANFTADLSYDANNVYLNLIPKATPPGVPIPATGSGALIVLAVLLMIFAGIRNRGSGIRNQKN